MLDIQPSPALPRFAFGQYDEIIMEGISYRAIDCSDDGYVFARTDGTGVSESFSHAVLSQRVTLGRLEHRRGAYLPQSAKRRLTAPAQQLSTLPAKQQQKAKYHESLVRAFLAMEAEGKVKRTKASVKSALPETMFQAGKYLSVPSEGDAIEAGGNRMIVPTKVSASRLLKRVVAFERDGMSAFYGRGSTGRRSRRIHPDELALLSKTVRNYLVLERPSIAQMVEDVRDAFIAETVAAPNSPEKRTEKRTARYLRWSCRHARLSDLRCGNSILSRSTLPGSGWKKRASATHLLGKAWS